MDQTLAKVDNMYLVKHEEQFYIIYYTDPEVRPLTFLITKEDADEIIADPDSIFDVVVKYRGKELCCELWSLRYNHGEN